MPKLPLRELEEARANPVVYRAKLLGPAVNQPRSYGYFNALRDGIFEFHEQKWTKTEGAKGLKKRLKRFKNASKVNDTLDRFDWYADEYLKRGWPTARTRLNISISLPAKFGGSISCSGQVGRVDLADTGGYAAWMLRSGDANGWEDELQMPLIQEAVANELGVATEFVNVGIYSFTDRLVASRIFDEEQIQQARHSLNRLLRSLGYS